MYCIKFLYFHFAAKANKDLSIYLSISLFQIEGTKPRAGWGCCGLARLLFSLFLPLALAAAARRLQSLRFVLLSLPRSLPRTPYITRARVSFTLLFVEGQLLGT